ncbi:hypothetical protein HDV05_005060 [Chytridiales sp. JEL 0842]|nr:hypothetical protein HDV05_005060 [Chytridiales sp. JEL 0842]
MKLQDLFQRRRTSSETRHDSRRKLRNNGGRKASLESQASQSSRERAGPSDDRGDFRFSIDFHALPSAMKSRRNSNTSASLHVEHVGLFGRRKSTLGVPSKDNSTSQRHQHQRRPSLPSAEVQAMLRSQLKGSSTKADAEKVWNTLLPPVESLPTDMIQILGRDAEVHDTFSDLLEPAFEEKSYVFPAPQHANNSSETDDTVSSHKDNEGISWTAPNHISSKNASSETIFYLDGLEEDPACYQSTRKEEEEGKKAEEDLSPSSLPKANPPPYAANTSSFQAPSGPEQMVPTGFITASVGGVGVRANTGGARTGPSSLNSMKRSNSAASIVSNGDEDYFPADVNVRKRKPHRGVVLPTFDEPVVSRSAQTAGFNSSEHQEESNSSFGVSPIPTSLATIMPRTSKLAEKMLKSMQKFFFNDSNKPLPKIVPEDGFKSPSSIKKVVIIGVHGWFPQKWIQNVLGPRTGTSQRFAHNASKALKKYLRDKHGIELQDCDITLIPLEKEGKIRDRVKGHLAQVLNMPVKSLDELPTPENIAGSSGVGASKPTTSAAEGSGIVVAEVSKPLPGLPESKRLETTPTETVDLDSLKPVKDTAKQEMPTENASPFSNDKTTSESIPSSLPSASPPDPLQTSSPTNSLPRPSQTNSPTNSLPRPIPPFTKQQSPTPGPLPTPRSTSTKPIVSPTFTTVPGIQRTPTQTSNTAKGKQQQAVDPDTVPLINNKGWKEAIMNADFVMVAAHSQGVPVSTILIDLLIQCGVLKPAQQRILFHAMAGIWHGPFPSLQSVTRYMDSPAVNEFFELCNTDSEISKTLQGSLAKILSANVRCVTVASWFDEVVPLLSGICQAFDHPSLFRAIYIDETIQDLTGDDDVDFLTQLVQFSLKLRNRGLSDHGMSIHLSKLLAGAFFGQAARGHSSLYDEIETYTLAISYAFGTPDNPQPAPLKVRPFQSPAKINPYGFTFAMARLVGSPHIHADPILKAELADLVEKYDRWEPKDQTLRLAKYSLEGLKIASLRENLIMREALRDSGDEAGRTVQPSSTS